MAWFWYEENYIIFRAIHFLNSGKEFYSEHWKERYHLQQPLVLDKFVYEVFVSS